VAPSLRRLLRHETILAVLVVVALVVLAAQSDRFFTADNLLNQGRLMAEVGLVALTMTFVIVTGGIDLSVGSILGLSAILVGVFWKNVGLALPVAMILAVGAGGLAGLANGLIITRFRVPPLIATLASLALYRGLAEGISQSRSVRGYPEWFYVLGQRDAAGVPVQVWIMLVAVVVSGAILGLTTFGRATYAIGANETAARFSGVAVDRTRLLIYTASGLMSGLRVACLDHAFRHGHRARARRHHRRRPRRDQHLRRKGDDRGDRPRPRPDPGPPERPVPGRRERRRDDRRHRIGADRGHSHQQHLRP
jgi:rhamnose transport system permease protein